MRGSDRMQEALFTVSELEDFVPSDHPLTAIRGVLSEALSRSNGLFNHIYADTGRASIAPEKLLRAILLQVIFSVRSERRLVEQIRYNLLYRWFIGLAIDDEVWDHSSFSRNRDRLLEHAVVESFFTEVTALAEQRKLLSRGSTNPDARLFRKGQSTAALLAYPGACVNGKPLRSGGGGFTHADGYGERAARWQCWTHSQASIPERLQRTRPTTHETSCRRAASGGSRRTWPATRRAGAAVPSTR